MDFYQTFATRLSEARKKNGLSQIELAKQIGVSQGTISAYEKGTGQKGSGPTVEKVARIAVALGVSVDWLCGIDAPVAAEIDPAAWLGHLFVLLGYYVMPESDGYIAERPIDLSISTDEYEGELDCADCVAEIKLHGIEMYRVFRTFHLLKRLRQSGADTKVCDDMLQALIKEKADLFKDTPVKKRRRTCDGNNNEA